jgi:hypothetical protein
MEHQDRSRPLQEKRVTPIDMDGSLFASEMDQETLELFDEIAKSGHRLGLSTTDFEFKSPFVQVGYAEIVGASAIRAYFDLPERA